MAKEQPQGTKQEKPIQLTKDNKNNFVIVYDTIYKNNDLTIEELGLLLKLLAMSPTYKLTFRNLQHTLKISQRKLQKTINLLKEKGYLNIDNNFNGGSKWILTQQPIQAKISKTSVNQLVYSLITCKITTDDIRQLWKQKIINYATYQKVLAEYVNELQRIIHINPYEND